jgi:hypothetical protein
MPRTKGTEPRHHVTPTRIQDGTALEDGIFITIIEEFIAPIEERLEIIEAALGALQTLARITMGTAVVELRWHAHGGTSYIDGDFTADSVGRPAMVLQLPNGDEDEGGIVQFTGEVLTTRKMRLRWHAHHGAPKRVPVVYLIG